LIFTRWPSGLIAIDAIAPENVSLLVTEFETQVMPDSETPLTQVQCTGLVNQYLAGQDWQLAPPAQFAAEIWLAFSGGETAGGPIRSAVQTEILRRYSTLLHHGCSRPDSAGHDRAWHELKRYLEKHVPRLESHPDTQQEIVQETLINLQSYLSQSELHKPHSFLIFAAQTMKRQQIDHHRRQTAEKRDWRKTIPLEEYRVGHVLDKENQNWEEYLSASSGVWRTIETTVSNQEVRRQLLHFAQEHLSSPLQQQVFEAHFIDGLQPAEIAQLFNKQPHEIRLVKARIVKKMRNLPPQTVEQLLEILGRLTSDG
jgi:RNA polymerase sigma factor (sigma-70 family)